MAGSTLMCMYKNTMNDSLRDVKKNFNIFRIEKQNFLIRNFDSIAADAG